MCQLSRTLTSPIREHHLNLSWLNSQALSTRRRNSWMLSMTNRETSRNSTCSSLRTKERLHTGLRGIIRGRSSRISWLTSRVWLATGRPRIMLLGACSSCSLSKLGMPTHPTRLRYVTSCYQEMLGKDVKSQRHQLSKGSAERAGITPPSSSWRPKTISKKWGLLRPRKSGQKSSTRSKLWYSKSERRGTHT